MAPGTVSYSGAEMGTAMGSMTGMRCMQLWDTMGMTKMAEQQLE